MRIEIDTEDLQALCLGKAIEAKFRTASGERIHLILTSPALSWLRERLGEWAKRVNCAKSVALGASPA